MRYFLVAGEASGDLHASNLMSSIKQRDSEAEFMFLGGDLMSAQGGVCVRHYKEMAFMGILSVIKNLDKVFANFKICKNSILSFKPDVVILVDYPSFNLKIAKFVKQKASDTPVFYYISPKLWAWKEYRLKDMKRYVDRVYSILPFEVEYFKKHDFEVEYVGNPCVDAVRDRENKEETFDAFVHRNSLGGEKPILALLSGSRKQEIKSSLPIMLQSASSFHDYQLVIAGAPSMSEADYLDFIKGYDVKIVFNQTYELLQQSDLAIVTSGTATLETALLRVPQVVVYMVSGGKIIHKLLEQIIHVPFISLVNLILGRQAVRELIMEQFNEKELSEEIKRLTQPEYRRKMISDYDEIISMLGNERASDVAANAIIKRLKGSL